MGSSTMRDRLEELQQRAQDLREAARENTNPFSVEGNNDESVVVEVITPQAVVFEEEPIIENFLSEAQQIRDDITVLETEVIFFFFCRSCVFIFLYNFSKFVFKSTFEVPYCTNKTLNCFCLSLVIFSCSLSYFNPYITPDLTETLRLYGDAVSHLIQTGP